MKKIRTAFFIGLFSILSAASIFASESSQEATNSKKGIALTLPDSTTALDLGAKNIIMNNPIGAHYDKALGILKSQGLSNTVIMFNPWNNGNNLAILPTATQKKGAILYGFNTSEEGKKALTELANRYAAAYGENVDNWVIGNEINHPARWNYVPDMSLDAYAMQYAQSFRIWYDAIKEHNPNANVYIPFDYRFNWSVDQGEGVLQAKPLLESLNHLLKDTDYGVAWHAYPEGLANPDFTDDANAIDSPDTQIVNMKNIHVLTDLMQEKEFLNPNQEVRSIILSEQGFNAVNEDLQAQMVQQAYEIAVANPHIDVFFLSREKDLGEVHGNQEMKFGLMDSAGNKRKAYYVYKSLE